MSSSINSTCTRVHVPGVNVKYTTKKEALQWRNYGRAGGAVAPPLLKNQKQ